MKVNINGKNIDYFDNITVEMKLDSVASLFSFSVKFDPHNEEHKDLFKPLTYHNVEIYTNDGLLLLTGTVLKTAFNSDSGVNLVSLHGYSKSGILEDVTIPVKHYPLQSDGLTIKEVFSKICGYFDIKVLFGPGVNSGKKIFKTTASATDSVKSYLAKITAQQNILLSHNENGDLYIFKPNDQAKPKYYFNDENSLEMSADFDGQSLHSEINVVRQPSVENAGVSTADKVNNPLVGKYRPVTSVLSSGDDVDVNKAADNILASELKAISVKVKLLGIFDDIRTGDIINIHNHEIYIFAYVRFMVSSVVFSENSKGDNITSLELLLPETFTGKQPKNILFSHKTHNTHI